MSGRGPLTEDVDDDDRAFLEAAQKDVALAASLLMCLSNPERYFPWWRPQESSAEISVLESHRGLYNWGGRRWRSRGTTREAISATKREETNRASPTTPLSWSGVSGTSESVCEEGWGTHKRRLKPPMEVRWNGAEMAEPEPLKRPRSDNRSPASAWMKTEDDAFGVFYSLESSAVRSSAVVSSNKEIASAGAAAEPSILAVRVEPLRLRLGADAASSVATRRASKKKTLPELKMLEESLLRDQAELLKTIEEQKEILVALREENLKMTKLKSDVADEGRRGLLFDLNCEPEEEDR